MPELFQLLSWVYFSLFALGLSSVFLARWRLPILLRYGKTLEENKRRNHNLLSSLLHLTVPKKWFRHFYVLSSCLSALNLSYSRNTVSLLVVLHSLRRAYETYYINNFGSHSRMHVSHYLAGLWFYTSLNIAVAVSSSSPLPIGFRYFLLIVFALASFDQYMNHLHLSHLVKYTLPKYGLFKIVSNAHYFDEILIYLSLTLYTTSFEMLCCLVWVVVNLSTSALETREWYSKRFPTATPPYAIVPYIL